MPAAMTRNDAKIRHWYRNYDIPTNWATLNFQTQKNMHRHKIDNIKLHFCLTVHHQLGKVILINQLDATNDLLIYKISSTCFGQYFAHHQERETEIFTAYGNLLLW